MQEKNRALPRKSTFFLFNVECGKWKIKGCSGFDTLVTEYRKRSESRCNRVEITL